MSNKIKIGNVELKNNLIAGPMAGISNLVFREICKEGGAGLVVSEMISDKAICYKNKKTLEMLKISKNEHPIALQLFGCDVYSMVMAAKYIEENTDCDILDINMGCPVPKVYKSGSGCKLMSNPEKAFDIVSAITKSINLPVTVKIRLGEDSEHINCVEFALLMEKAGASAITIHARTRKQLYEGSCDWSYIKKIKEKVKIPVIGNGDVKSKEDYERMIKETSCDAVMISRGCIGHKDIFNECNGINSEEDYKTKQIKDCLDHAKRLSRLLGEDIALKQMRMLVGYYLKGFNNVRRVRQDLNNVKTYEQLELILNNLISDDII